MVKLALLDVFSSFVNRAPIRDFFLLLKKSTILSVLQKWRIFAEKKHVIHTFKTPFAKRISKKSP
jgi:hypothetical protein